MTFSVRSVRATHVQTSFITVAPIMAPFVYTLFEPKSLPFASFAVAVQRTSTNRHTSFS